MGMHSGFLHLACEQTQILVNERGRFFIVGGDEFLGVSHRVGVRVPEEFGEDIGSKRLHFTGATGE
jgi:hypothetical protein